MLGTSVQDADTITCGYSFMDFFRMVSTPTSQGHKGMVVDKSIKVKKLVFIEGVVHCDRLVDKLSGPCDGHKIDGTKDIANMDDCNVSNVNYVCAVHMLCT